MNSIHMIGRITEADFQLKTITLKIDGHMEVMAGDYVIAPAEMPVVWRDECPACHGLGYVGGTSNPSSCPFRHKDKPKAEARP